MTSSNGRAVALRAFEAVADGEIYPRSFVAGDRLTGALADDAIRYGWAEAPGDVEAFDAAMAAASAPAAPEAADPADIAAAIAEVARLRTLAGDRAIEIGELRNKIAALEAELVAAKAAAPAEPAAESAKAKG